MQRFTGYRHNISQRDSHTDKQKNADHEPQYEGVIWSDGSCTIKWMTSVTSTSVFASFADFVTIHGHPEYGTELDFHDGMVPYEWGEAVARYVDGVARETANASARGEELVAEIDAQRQRAADLGISDTAVLLSLSDAVKLSRELGIEPPPAPGIIRFAGCVVYAVNDDSVAVAGALAKEMSE